MLPKKDREKVIAARAKIVLRLKLSDGILLTDLLCRNVITEKQCSTVLATTDRFKQASKLLDILLKGDGDTLQNFIFALSENGYAEFVEDWFGETSKKGCSSESLQQATKVAPKLAQGNISSTQKNGKTTQRTEPGVAGRTPALQSGARARVKSCALKSTGTSFRRTSGRPKWTVSTDYPRCSRKQAWGPSETAATTEVKQPDLSGKMTMRSRLALLKSRRELVKDIDVMPTIDWLLSTSVLSQEDCERIQEKSTVHDKRRALLDILPERGQLAYEELCQCLAADQHWLHHDIKKQYNSLSKADIAEAEDRDRDKAQDDVELEDLLRHNLRDKLQQWKTALEEGTSSQGGQLSYLQQPCTLKATFDEENIPSTDQLAENSSPGDRVIIYGDAGMGKTTLLKHLAQTWIEKKNVKLLKKFKYVFLIPMRFVGNMSLLNIICDELDLVPVSNMKELRKCLDRNERKTLFLLDSYEELRSDVIERQKTEIGDLIKGRMYPKSTVLVTSRPHSRLKYRDHYKVAQLKDLPEAEVKQIIEQHFGENEKAVNQVLRSFPAMSFLQKPINLALFLFIIKENGGILLSYTQAELFNLMLQYIMLAYVKKKGLFEFCPQSGSYLKNKGIPREVRLLFQSVSKKCYEEKRKNSVILHMDEDELKDYMEFGLFTAGPDAHSIVLPHPLFQDYFTAAYLAENPEAWKIFFEEIRRQFESETPRLRLIDVVQPLMVENVVRFVVALAPHVCEDIGTLFVLECKKMKDCDNYQLIKFEYYTDFLRDCSDENGKHVLANALVNAPVKYLRERTRVRRTRIRDSGSSVLLPYLNYRQRVDFLKNVFGLDLRVEDSESTLSCSGNRLGISDKFVVSIACLYNCTINADKLYIRGKNGCCIDIPVSMVSRNMAGVRQLRLAWCKLHKEVSAEMLNLGMSNDAHTDEPASSSEKNTSLERVELYKVQGLDNCDVFTSRRCQLEVWWCDDVTIGTVQACFPQLSDFELKFDTTLVYGASEDLSAWLSTVQTVKELKLAPPQRGECLNLCHLLSLLAEEKKVEFLLLSKYTLVWDDKVKDTMKTVSPNNTLSTLRLVECQDDVDLNRLLEVSDLCPELKRIEVENSSLILDDEVGPVNQLANLQSVILQKSSVHTTSGRRLSDHEIKQSLRKVCPSTAIDIWIL